VVVVVVVVPNRIYTKTNDIFYLVKYVFIYSYLKIFSHALIERENGYLLSFQKMYVLRRNVETSSVLENYSF